MSLDDMYGPCVEPGRSFSAAEGAYLPSSLDELTDETAPILKDYLDSASRGLKLPQTVHRTTTVLWVVDEEGRFWFAIEELVEGGTGDLMFPIPRGNYPYPDGGVKLGHPSLVAHPNKHARIGGEISFNPDTNRWEINNYSGRYGTRKHQLREHLEAVAGKLNNYNIHLDVCFSEP